MRRKVAPVITLLFIACSGSPDDGSPWLHETEIDGNTLTVRTISGSVWNSPARLEEEASIGVVDGPEEYMLGRVVGLYAGDNRIYLINQKPLVVRAYDFDGGFLFNVGKRGSGPGEYLGPASIVADQKDGHILIRDAALSRLNIYAPSGEYLESWRLRTGILSFDPMVLTTAGELFDVIRIPSAGRTLHFHRGMVRITQEGTTEDTLAVPVYGHEPWIIEYETEDGLLAIVVPFAPDVVWAMSPLGEMVSGYSSDYRLRIDRLNGSTMIIERECEPVPFQAEERQWYRDRELANIQRGSPGFRWTGPDIPARKPFFDALVPDRDGRIWVVRIGPGVRLEGINPEPENPQDFERNPLWKQTYSADVFDPEGRFLGSLELPEGFMATPRPYIEGETVIAAVEGGDGLLSVKRYRLVVE